MRPEVFDVAIVGGGPAGAHLALRQVAAGRSVVLLERRVFPRAKPCGEFLGPQCQPLLEELGLLDEVRRAGARTIGGLSLFGYGRCIDGRFGTVANARETRTNGLALGRERLDELTLRAAAARGVCVLEGHSVRGLVRSADGAVLGVDALDAHGEPLTVRAHTTIGADGLHSRVAHALGVVERVPWLSRLAITTRVEGFATDGRAEVHFVRGGYFALSPVDGGASRVNLVVELGAQGGGRSHIAQCFREHLERAPELRERLAPHLAPAQRFDALGPLATRTRAQVFDGAALVGDACGYVDPLTGEGLYFAMRGAALLHTHLEEAARSGRRGAAALAGYARARTREFGHRRALALLLQRGLRSPRVAAGVLAVLATRPRLADVLLDATGSALPPRALLSPKLWLDVLRAPPRTPDLAARAAFEAR
jgi:flavin-dependent dehydrogenase